MMPPNLSLRAVLILGTLVIWTNPLLAQTAPKPKEPPIQLISFIMVGGSETRAMGQAEDPGAEFKFKTGKEIRDLNLAPGLSAGPFARPAGDTVQVYREQPSGDPKIPPTIIPVAEVKISSEMRNVAVLVVAPRQGEVRLLAISQDKKNLPEGHIGFVSLLPFEVRAKFGPNEVSIPAKGRASASAGLTGNEVAMVGLQMAAPVDGEWRLVESKRIAFDPSSRSLLLLSPGEGKPLRLTFIDAAPADPVDPDAAAPQAAPAANTR